VDDARRADQALLVGRDDLDLHLADLGGQVLDGRVGGVPVEQHRLEQGRPGEDARGEEVEHAGVERRVRERAAEDLLGELAGRPLGRRLDGPVVVESQLIDDRDQIGRARQRGQAPRRHHLHRRRPAQGPARRLAQGSRLEGRPLKHED
jgi:hypothetical protein